jgi:hypothetical protein
MTTSHHIDTKREHYPFSEANPFRYEAQNSRENYQDDSELVATINIYGFHAKVE